MVDVAFQLVLFFLVTTATVVFKTLEVPRPNEDKPPEAAAQARSKSIDELEKDYILVEVDAAGALKVDRQPIAADRAALAEKLRATRQATGRKAMLLSADFATKHENAVLAFDVANEVDLAIAIAQPTGKK
jgi:biopolymer transport protein ExbD